MPALARNEVNFITYGGNWVTTDTAHMRFGIFDLLQVTVCVSLFALLLAMPVALGIAIFLTHYAPRRVGGPLSYLVDLLAAVPSIIYGVWGLYVLAPVLSRSRCGSTSIWAGCFCSAPATPQSPVAALCSPPDRAGGDDPADHHRGRPRGVRSDAARQIEVHLPWARPVGRWSRPRSCPSACPAMSVGPCSAWAAHWARRSRC